MQPLEFLEKCIADFSAKRMAILFMVLALGVIALVSYELTTSTFKLDKYLKATELLTDLEPLLSSESDSVRTSAQEMASQVQAILLNESSNTGFSADEQRKALVILMAVPWLLMSLAGFYEAWKQEPDWGYGVVGCFILAFLFGWASYYIPTSVHWSYRYIVIPFLSYAILASAFMRFQMTKMTKVHNKFLQTDQSVLSCLLQKRKSRASTLWPLKKGVMR